MILLIDTGNSLISMGIHNGDTIIKKFSLKTAKIKTKDEFAIFLINLLNLNKIEMTAIDGVIISSVVPYVNEALIGAIQAYLGVKPIIIEPGIKAGIVLKVDNPKEVGSDLIADGVCGLVKYGGDCVLVNCGTATKCSVINKKGEWLGVAIAPGYEIASEALYHKTATLPHVGFAIPKNLMGKNSAESVAAGLYYGYQGLIRNLIYETKRQYGQHLKVILSGGVSIYFESVLRKDVDVIDYNLTLEGLKIIYEKNKA